MSIITAEVNCDEELALLNRLCGEEEKSVEQYRNICVRRSVIWVKCIEVGTGWKDGAHLV